jgi:phage terminase large subunit-like protein
VAVDPRVAAEETGIVVAGRDADGDCYVLADRSVPGTPRQCMWAALSAHDEYRADAIAGVTNLVGSYMETLLYRERYFQGDPKGPDLAFRPVTLHRGILERCKPVGVLYEQGSVHHVGALPELEDRMFTWLPGDRKPMGRLEALVCAITELAS